ncbi:REF/SRPP-like protein At3g05500 [Bidens hawaiensis]|uniref:REF/SRPP-like protein At3g05500 n=1 Tax=Bidens hawaiensis TaxID=980011 RepID=UPI00404B63AA
MAENNVPVTTNYQSEIEREEEQRLKHLQFVQMAALHALLYASKAYAYAKNNSGPLKPRVETMEGKLKTAVGPTYNKFHHYPIFISCFYNRKLDESVNKFDTQVQPFVKQVSAKTNNLSQEVKTAYTKLEPAAIGLFTKYEPVAEWYAASAWQSLNQLPVFPKVAKVVVPTAAYCSDKYNQTVQQTAEKGYKVSSYLPLVPAERIAKVFNPVGPQAEPVA